METHLFPSYVQTERLPLPSLKIGKVEVEYPIVQGGMGVGVSNSDLV